MCNKYYYHPVTELITVHCRLNSFVRLRIEFIHDAYQQLDDKLEYTCDLLLAASVELRMRYAEC